MKVVKIDIYDKLPKKRVVKKKKKLTKKGSVEAPSNDKKKSFYRASPKKMYGTYAYPSPREKSEE